jgi:hypothetical protein
MAISIDYNTFEINVPKADTVFVEFDAVTGREKRRLSVDIFWRALADVQDNEDDVWAPTAFENIVPVDLGTFVQGRAVIVLAPYIVTFEDGTYSVELTDGNSNIQARTTVNSVQILSANTAGLVQVTSGSGLSDAQATQLSDIHSKLPSDGEEIAGENDALANVPPTTTEIADAVWNKTLP